MIREDYEEMKRLLAETRAELREGTLSPVLTAALEHCCAVAAAHIEQKIKSNTPRILYRRC